MIKKLIQRIYLGNKNLILNLLNKPLKPRWIWFGVTDRCNSHCTHCNIWQMPNSQNQLTLAEIEKIFRDPLLSEIEAITNSGGEAILRPDIVELIKLEYKLFPKANLDLSTNGILAERVLEVVKELMTSKVKIIVGVSLDGLGEKHDKIRGVPGNFNKVDFLLKELIKLRQQYPELLSLIIGFTLSRHTIDSWQETKEYADKLGVELMIQWYNQSSFYGNNKDEDENLRKKMLATVALQPKSSVQEKWLKLLRNESIKFKCSAADSFFVLKCDGEVVPCLSHWGVSLGNARDQSVTEIWQSEKAVAARKIVANCQGCLNSWGVNWSMTTFFYPRLFYFLRHPIELAKRLKKGNQL